MIVRYSCAVFIGALVENRILLWGLTVRAFVLTLALASRHGGLWRSDAASSTSAAVQPPESKGTPTDEAAPAAATVDPAPAVTPSPPERSEPQASPETLARRDRAGEHDATSHQA